MTNCLFCGKAILGRQKKYCSNKCQSDKRYADYVTNWKKGIVSGNRGINTHNISNHLKRYLVEKSGEKCSICYWSIKHSSTGKVPLEIDHINGNPNDNNECNLRLICPNCHSLSSNFRNLNKGRGRVWRKKYYTNNL